MILAEKRAGGEPVTRFLPRRLYPKLSVDALYTAFTAEYGTDFYFTGESHDMWELDCVMSGAAGFTSGTRLYECAAGELVIHPGGVFHTAWAMDQPVRILTVSFSGDGVSERVPAGKFSLTSFERSLTQLLGETVDAYYGQRPLPEYAVPDGVDQMAKGLTETLLSSLSLRRGETAAPSAGEASLRFMEITAFMKDHITENLRAAQICTACGVSRSVLKELFRRYTGGGPMEYFAYLRVRQAIQLMERGLSMAAVAAAMNFSSQNYYSAFFKRMTGMSPSAYRTGRRADGGGR